jgi:hypothetical protein
VGRNEQALTTGQVGRLCLRNTSTTPTRTRTDITTLESRYHQTAISRRMDVIFGSPSRVPSIHIPKTMGSPLKLSSAKLLMSTFMIFHWTVEKMDFCCYKFRNIKVTIKIGLNGGIRLPKTREEERHKIRGRKRELRGRASLVARLFASFYLNFRYPFGKARKEKGGGLVTDAGVVFCWAPNTWF